MLRCIRLWDLFIFTVSNEVAKVMFSQACVYPRGGGVCACSGGRGVPALGRGCVPAPGGVPALGGLKVAEFPKLALIHGILPSLLI